ncbi:MAG: MFS transporter [Thaumarchaeota archaeon]|nr:MFS transporter [Nitrososphaerota archaeon]
MNLDNLGLTRNIVLVSFSVSLLILGFNLSTSLLVLYLSQLGFNSFMVGLIVTVARLAFALLTLPSGVIADKLGYRLPIVWSFSLCSISLFLMYLVSNPLLFSILVVLLWIGTAIYGPSISSYVSKASSKGKVALAFGWYYAFTTTSQVIGQTLSGIMAQNFGYKSLFAVGGVLSLFSLVIVTYVVRKSNSSTKNNFILFTLDDFKKGLDFFIKNSSVRKLSIALSFHTIGFLTSYTFIPLVASLDQNFDDATIGLLLAIWSIGNAVFQIPFGKLSDKVGGKIILLLHVLLSSLIWWVYPFVNSFLLAVVIMIVQGVVGAMDMPARRLIMQDVSEENFATAVGVLDSFTTFAGSLGPFISGVLWNYGHWAPFVFGSAINFVSFLLLIL